MTNTFHRNDATFSQVAYTDLTGSPTLPSTTFLVIGPGTNTDLNVPQWNGANSLTLKDGLSVGTSSGNLIQMAAGPKLPAVDGSSLTNLNAEPILTSSTYPVGVALMCVNIGVTTLANNTTISGASLNNLIATYNTNCCGTFFGVTVSGVTLPGTWKNVSGISLIGSGSGSGVHPAGGQFVRTA